MPALQPSPDSALILRIQLPPGLGALRTRHVPDAAEGVPAHVTLLYPFATPASTSVEVLDSVAAIVREHREWSMTLAAQGRWPDALYATVEPDGPVRTLQADLAAAFPMLPLYGDPGVRFEPHVTIVEGPGVADPAVLDDPAWGELPAAREVAEIQLIVRERGRWRIATAFPLGSAATASR